MRKVAAVFVFASMLVCAGCDKSVQNQVEGPVKTSPTQAIPDFVGFKLGAPASSIQECGRDQYGGHSSDGKNVCWWTTEHQEPNNSGAGMPDGLYMIEFPLHMIPNGIKTNGNLIFIDNIVQQIELQSSSLSAQSNLIALLKSKYGEPDEFEWKTMTTKGGERIPSFSGTWRYTNGYIWAEEGFVKASTYDADAWVKRGFGKNADSF